MRSYRSAINYIDIQVAITAIALIFMGLLAIYSSNYVDETTNLFTVSSLLGRQSIFLILALLSGIVIFLFESKTFEVAAPIIYGLSIALLLFVLFFGTEVAGSRSWIRIGSFGIQPSEFAKIGTCIFLAQFMSRRTFDFKDFKQVISCLLIIALPALLIILQGDTGSALVFGSFALMLYRRGFSSVVLGLLLILIALSVIVLKFNYLWPMGIIGLMALLFYTSQKRKEKLGFVLIGAAIVIGISVPLLLSGTAAMVILLLCCVIGGALWYNYRTDHFGIVTLFLVLAVQLQAVDFGYKEILLPHQKTRIDVLLGKRSDIKGVGYNINQSKIAIGSGGIVGKGFLQGTQTKGNFVPAQKTDFIFCTIAEEWGFIGSTVLIALFLALLFRLIYVAERQRNSFSLLFIYGVAGIFFFHFLVNIGMTIGLAPIIGIPLPFISYGGSSLLAFCILIFLVLRIDVDRTVV